MKALNIIETAYRATLEEQDDTIVWITHAMKGAGADLAVLLRGNAVNYTVKGQSVAPLAFGARRQKHGPDIARDVAGLVVKDVPVYYVAEDAANRGLDTTEMIEGLTPIHLGGLPQLMESYDQVWHW